MFCLQVEIANYKDIIKLKAFFWEAWRQAGPNALGFTGATESIVEEIASTDHLKSLIEGKDTKTFICYSDDNIVGFCTNRRIDDQTVELAGLIVLQELIGRGIGSMLLEKAKSGAISDNFCSMIVKTEAYNKRAILFYTKKGFKKIDEREEDVLGTKVKIVELVINLKEKCEQLY